MNLGAVALWGLVATLILTTVQTGSQALGLTRMSLPLMLGTAFSSSWVRARAYGFVVHFMSGWLFSLVYAALFESLGRSGWWLGGVGGMLHGVAYLVLFLPLLASVHPRMANETRNPSPTTLLEPPGHLALNYGPRTPLVILASHAAFGVVLGGFYPLAG